MTKSISICLFDLTHIEGTLICSNQVERKFYHSLISFSIYSNFELQIWIWIFYSRCTALQSVGEKSAGIDIFSLY